jgi:voltage-gated potassium channel
VEPDEPPDEPIDSRRLNAYETRTTIPLLILAVAIIPLLVIPSIAELSPTTERALLVADWIIWGVFPIDYFIRLSLAPYRAQFIRNNKLDVVIIILPFLRPLRVVRSARSLRLLRAARTTTLLGRGLKAGSEILTRHKLHYAILTTLAVVIGAALLVHSLEATNPESNIRSLGDALWWAGATVTTVGFGDAFPTTPGGRAVGIILMVVGISLFGFVAGSLVSYFVHEDEEKSLDPQLVEITERLKRIEDKL